MIRKLLRSLLRAFLRILMTVLCAVVAGVFGWCLIGWMNGVTNSPKEIYRSSIQSSAPSTGANGAEQAALFKQSGEAIQQGKLERGLRGLYQLSLTASPGEIEALRGQFPNRRPKWFHYFFGLNAGDSRSKDYFAGSVYVASVLRTWFAGDRAACMEAIGNLPPYLQGKLPTRLLKAVSLLDGKLALQMLGPQIMNLIPPDGMNVTLHAWAEQDLAGALAFAQQLGAPKHRALAMAGVLAVMATTDPARSIQLLAELPASDRASVANGIASQMDPAAVLQNFTQLAAAGATSCLWPSLATLSRSDPSAAQQWLAAHPEAWLNKEFDAAIQRHGYTPGNTSSLLRLCQSCYGSDPELTSKIQSTLAGISQHAVGQFFTTEPVQAWLAQQTDPGLIAPALRGMLTSSNLSYVDSSSTILGYATKLEQLNPGALARTDSAWLKQLVENPAVSDAEASSFAPILSVLTPKQQAKLVQIRPSLLEPTAAMQLPFQVQDFFTRQDLELKLVQTYAPEHPQEIAAWINTLPTEEERTEATKAWQHAMPDP